MARYVPLESTQSVIAAIATIDWSRLRHLRGPATDIPNLLRELGSAEADARRHALRVLGTRILPFYDGIDGAVCEVTGHAVPILARLAASDVADAAEILALLRRIAQVAWDRDPYRTPSLLRRFVVPEAAPRAARTAVARARALVRDASAALFRHFDPVAAELLYGHRTHVALAAALPLFFGLLGHPREEVRTEAARLIERIGQSASRPTDMSLRIVRHLERERDELVIAHLVLALGHVGDREARTLLEALLDAQDPWVRVIAAVSLAPPPLERSPRRRLEILVGALTAPEALAERYEITTSRALYDDVARGLTASERDRSEVGSLLLGVLAESRHREVPEALLDVLLEVLFPDASEPVSPTALSREQRLVLNRLQSATDRLRGRDRDLSAKLAAKGLPTDPKGLARFVQVN